MLLATAHTSPESLPLREGLRTGSQYFRTFHGVAEGVNLIDLQVLDQNGNGTDSGVIAALQKAIALKSTLQYPGSSTFRWAARCLKATNWTRFARLSSGRGRPAS